jgi:hypothetical protein
MTSGDQGLERMMEFIQLLDGTARLVARDARDLRNRAAARSRSLPAGTGLNLPPLDLAKLQLCFRCLTECSESIRSAFLEAMDEINEGEGEVDNLGRSPDEPENDA